MVRYPVILLGFWGLFLLLASITVAEVNTIAAYEGSTLWGFASDVAVSGDFAYYTKGYGLEVVDISDPYNRMIVSRMRLNSSATSIFIAGDKAYITLSSGGFSILDISNPYTPSILNTFDMDGNSQNITISGNIAFVSQENSALYLINIANPLTPYLLSVFNTVNPPREVAVSGHYAYITQTNYGLQIIDFLDATAPELVGVFEGVGSYNGTDYWDIILYGDYAFIADYAYSVTNDSGGFQVLNVSNPTAPELQFIYDLHLVNNLALDGTTLYISTQTTGVHSFDVAMPSSPVYLDNNLETAYVKEMAVYNDYLVTCGRNCEIYDIADPESIELASFNPVMSEVASVFVSGDYAYIGHRYSGLTIVDISNPAAPEMVANHATSGRAYTTQVRDQLAYVTNTSGMDIFDVSDPTNPVLLGSFQDSDTSSCEEFTLIGNLAYITGYPYEIYIVDITNPAAPELLTTYTPEGVPENVRIESIDIIGNYAYICEVADDIVHIVDISNPMAPTKVSEFSGFWTPMKTNFFGNYAYLCNTDNLSWILDVTDPINPVKIGEFAAASQFVPGYAGDFIFFADWSSGFNVYNMADVTNPEFIGCFDTPGSAYHVIPSGDHVYVADQIAFLVMSLNLPTFRSGDANGDGMVDVGDAVHLINYIFRGGAAPEPLDAGDANCDGEVNVGDAVFLINYIFNGGNAPCYNN